LPRQIPHPRDVAGPRRHRDGAARIEQVEDVRGLEHLVVCGQWERALEQLLALRLVLVETAHEDVDRRLLEVVGGPLAFCLAIDLAPRHAWGPLELEGASLALEEER